MDQLEFPTISRARRAGPPRVQIANHLRTLIEQGRILPGAFLPPEGKLAAQLGFHRVTVNQAYQLLDDITESVSGIGRRVRVPSEPTWACVMSQGSRLVVVNGFSGEAAAKEWGTAHGAGHLPFVREAIVVSADQFERGMS